MTLTSCDCGKTATAFMAGRWQGRVKRTVEFFARPVNVRSNVRAFHQPTYAAPGLARSDSVFLTRLRCTWWKRRLPQGCFLHSSIYEIRSQQQISSFPAGALTRPAVAEPCFN